MTRRKSRGPVFGKPKKKSAAITVFAYFVVLPFVVLAMCPFFAESLWICAMVTNFSLSLSILAVGPLVLVVVCRRAVPAIILGVCIVLLTMPALTAPRAQRGVQGTQADARVLVFNAFAESPRFDRSMAMLREIEADVVLLNEINYQFTEAIAADEVLRERYPYRELAEHASQWNLAVLSRWPLERIEHDDSRKRELKFEYVYRRSQIVQHPETPFVTSITIPSSPRSSKDWQRGNEQLRSDLAIIRDYLAPLGLPIVIGTDLNASPASVRTRLAHELAGLRRAKPFGVAAGTWPSSMPAMFRVPIDDLLVSEGVRVTSWKTIESETESDHVPVLITIDLSDSEPTSQDP